jgi:hypothetical protein
MFAMLPETVIVTVPVKEALLVDTPVKLRRSCREVIGRDKRDAADGRRRVVVIAGPDGGHRIAGGIGVIIDVELAVRI